MMTQPAEDYLGAFLDGYEFLLLAFEGRLSKEGTDADDLDAFLEDYRRILELHRRNLADEAEARDEEALEEFRASLLPESRN